MTSFEELLAEAEQAEFEGWDFSVFGDRWCEESPSWDYRRLLLDRLEHTQALLDMGTGGGEFLSSLPLPSRTAATEGYPPNVPVARRRLEPLGVEVVTIDGDDLAFSDGSFDLVANRHESFAGDEVRRVLTSGGFFITQQVGGADNLALNEALDGPTHEYSNWSMDCAIDELRETGFRIVDADEEFVDTHFFDVGAVVLYLRLTPWQIPDFTIEGYRDALRRLHEQIEREGQFTAKSHRFVVRATPA